MMRIRGLVLVVLFGFALEASWADGEDRATERWIFRKGKAVQELDVSGLAEAVRATLKKSLAAHGWKLQVVEKSKPASAAATTAAKALPSKARPSKALPSQALPSKAPAPKALPSKAPVPNALPSKAPALEASAHGAGAPVGTPGDGETRPPVEDGRDLRKDLDALIRGGGRFPAGYVPHALRGGPVDPRAGGARRWGFHKKGATFVLDVAPLDAAARAALVAQLEAQGWGRQVLEVAEAAPSGSRPPPAGEGAGGPLRLLGAPVILDARGATFGDVPPDSLAAQAGFFAAQRVLAVGGRRPDRAGLRRAAAAARKGGKLSVRVLRRDGRIEIVDIEFE